MSYFDSLFLFFLVLIISTVVLWWHTSKFWCRYSDAGILFDRFKTSWVQPLAWKRQTHFGISHHLHSSSFCGWLLGKLQLAKHRPDTHRFFKLIFLHHSWWYLKNNVGMYQIQLVVSVSAAGKVVDHHRSNQLISPPPQLFLPCHIISVTEKQQWILGG